VTIKTSPTSYLIFAKETLPTSVSFERLATARNAPARVAN
jgi:hypothetical protein